MSPATHVDRVLRAANTQLPAVDTPQALIHRSWQRCLTQHGLDPHQAFDPRVESTGRVRTSRERLEEYLQVARGGMEQLFKHVADLGYVLLLTDAEGITIDYIGNDSWGRDAQRAGLYLGANWQEEFAGTNGIGTCIYEQRGLTCHRDEHFYVGNVGLSCSTAPLFHPDGKLMGVLDVSALAMPNARESQHLALHLTRLYAQMIDDANFTRHFSDRWLLRLATSWALVDVRVDMMLALDHDGCIVGANPAARRKLRAGPQESGVLDDVVGRHLSEVFHCTMDKLWRLPRSDNPADSTLLSQMDHKSYFASLVAPRLRGVADRPPLYEANDMAEPVAIGPSLRRLSGADRQMHALQQRAQRLANKRINLLIQGETGSGKEVFAKAIHESSNRRDKAFVAVNCAAIPESLIESELFGYTAGTFTGARTRGMKGLIQQAHGGTLFLDEIGDMPLHLQTRLLRVLSENEVLPLGAERPVPVELTVVAASHRDLRQLITAGTFREDLYYRLCGATLRLPSLRERHDMVYLIDLILREESESPDIPGHVTPETLKLLERYEWPGNVRQLRNVLRFCLALSDGHVIHPVHLPSEITACPQTVRPLLVSPVIQDSDARLRQVDGASPSTAQGLLALLQAHRWNVSAVAANLGLARTTIYRRMRRFGIVSPLDTLDLQS
ncbi:MAG: AAA family ATPase [Acidovorax sp. 17-64-282]|nr:MAG: AAA family ATPase [Acidovorax sp. 35-64-16]OYY85276.1 MAG: AAA family ATPase [Acidovorax sp. 28-64-14]OYZ66236.1 MAG: AAA family ATPase [Acidovorax sp. 24-64-9]OZA57946.1 MAG: AAA family ATPase [Acidovorax sp. 17-64-282]OZA67496.1 MAG: AAA family ATPase [Acidovorax sp. 39-64-12]